MRRCVLVGAAAAVFVLSACGSPGDASTADNGAKVATLRSAAPAGGPSAAASRPERPRERLGMTAEEYEALLEPYNRCMREQGFDAQESRKRAADAAAVAESGDDDGAVRANRICEPQYLPLPPWEKDPANPEARDFAVGVVKCLKGKGVKLVEVAEDGISIALGGENNDALSIRLGMEHMSACEREVAASS
ncbi:hypothetical protein FHR83_007958 [Actinoplanes campanulatus]|uniref:Lipoprotein n=1 Tax=Actinoplanes campanulatus TaxID=113559 RepID=A0A7W5AQ19_9ACTN|nr:hypothetical protein [Actinoplanes campanulatus]MBB3100236.1 hypothetical protein [Actinoplanes campanulatus]GGN44277.1 hypothetical protein GCM10010109_77330 [Actinoplanes campanulatus]GID40961.1 hypothetical protein Aca09nite_74670 [Actinoplanes campanulatus]